jgi:hypothetical protein
MMNITILNLYDSDYQLWLENTINQLRREDFPSGRLAEFIRGVGRFGKKVNDEH